MCTPAPKVRFNGISCAQATFYFHGIEDVFPYMSWKFYVVLSFHCEWSEYFVEVSTFHHVCLRIFICKSFVFHILLQKEKKSLKYFLNAELVRIFFLARKHHISVFKKYWLLNMPCLKDLIFEWCGSLERGMISLSLTKVQNYTVHHL
ncbi:UNVERIFIED_CONTAM: hypothetical protein NCL1_26991 [Trichonephila clavipes]